MVLSGICIVDDLPAFQSDWQMNGGDDVRAELKAYYDAK